MKTSFRVAFPGCCFLFLAFLLPAPGAAQQPACCTIAQSKGQEAFNRKDYAIAISHWTNGKKCPDAFKCPELDDLIQKARAEKKKIDDAAAAESRRQADLTRQREANAADEQVRQREAAAAKAADSAHDIAKTADSKAAYGAFIKNYPNSRHVADAQSRIEALDWLDAQNKNTKAAYEAFIKNYPNSRHVAEARGRIEPKPPSLSTETLAKVAPLQKLTTDMARIIGATFTMGCKSDRDTDCYHTEFPNHTVYIRDFSIGRYEVTQAQWRAVMDSDPPSLYNKGCDQCPVEGVSWDDIQVFLKKLNALTGKHYRLPTEAEWEYAARGGNQSKGYLYSGSNTIEEVAWYDANAKSGNTNGARKTTRPVGTKKPNELGLYDMSGNVWEWCEDDWHDGFNGAPTDGGAWVDITRGSYRVSRGGDGFSSAVRCRAASRFRYEPSYRSTLGFRLAL